MAQKIDRDRLEKAILLVRGGFSAAEAARNTGLSVPTLRVYLTRDDLAESKLNAKGQIKHFPTMTDAEAAEWDRITARLKKCGSRLKDIRLVCAGK